jgi:Na+-transporting NADH:ubiquinone oxidoreductase subunit NqrF
VNNDSAVLLEVFLGVGLFTAVVLILVFVILAARLATSRSSSTTNSNWPYRSAAS